MTETNSTDVSTLKFNLPVNSLRKTNGISFYCSELVNTIQTNVSCRIWCFCDQ